MNLVEYEQKMDQLLRKMILEGTLDQFDDGTVMISLHRFEKGKQMENTDLLKFYQKSMPIKVVEIDRYYIEPSSEEGEVFRSEEGEVFYSKDGKVFYTEDGDVLYIEETIEHCIRSQEESFTEYCSLQILANYLQWHEKFEYQSSSASILENSDTNEFIQYTTHRFKAIMQFIKLQLEKGIQIPYLEEVDILEDEMLEEEQKSSVISYNKETGEFLMNTEDTSKKVGASFAMSAMFEYMEQRERLARLETQMKENDDEGSNIQRRIDAIPLEYRKLIQYKRESSEIERKGNFIDDPR